jgi:hypothetical protein
MYKLSILTVLFTASVALSCDQVCYFAQGSNSQCVFACQAGQAKSTQQNTVDFLQALRRKGYSCSPYSGRVICRAFPGCKRQSWSTGPGC